MKIAHIVLSALSVLMLPSAAMSQSIETGYMICTCSSHVQKQAFYSAVSNVSYTSSFVEDFNAYEFRERVVKLTDVEQSKWSNSCIVRASRREVMTYLDKFRTNKERDGLDVRFLDYVPVSKVAD